MKAYPALIPVLLSSGARAASGPGVRGADAETEPDARRRRRNRRAAAGAGGDRGGGPFGGPTGALPGGIEPAARTSGEEARAGGVRALSIFGDDDSKVDEDEWAVAKLLDLSIDDAQELLRQQQDFAGLVDSLQDDGNFLQSEMPSEPNGTYVLRYKNGDVPQDSQKEVESFIARNEDAKLAIVPARLSLGEAEDRGQRLADELEREGYSHVAFSIDGDGIEVIAKKPHPQGRAPDEDGGRISAARAAEILGLQAKHTDLEGLALFLVEHDADDPARPHHTYGGRKIDGSGEQCTTAFTVIDEFGTTGIATAAHCTGMNNYDAVPPESDYPTVFQGEHKGAYGDVEWHTTSHPEPPYFYANPGTRLPVRSVAYSISKGQTVCAYSRMQGVRQCDQVFKTNVSVKYSGQPRMRKLVAMRGDFMVGGDSGGPWSFVDKAFGIHSGFTTICDFSDDGCNSRDLWSRVSYLPSALGVAVRQYSD